LTSVGQATNASSDEYALEKPPTSTMLSYVSPAWRMTLLPREP
jgi:hypothetical protein